MSKDNNLNTAKFQFAMGFWNCRKITIKCSTSTQIKKNHECNSPVRSGSVVGSGWIEKEKRICHLFFTFSLISSSSHPPADWGYHPRCSERQRNRRLPHLHLSPPSQPHYFLHSFSCRTGSSGGVVVVVDVWDRVSTKLLSM